MVAGWARRRPGPASFSARCYRISLHFPSSTLTITKASFVRPLWSSGEKLKTPPVRNVRTPRLMKLVSPNPLFHNIYKLFVMQGY